MIPPVVTFTGLEIEAGQLNRYVPGPIPLEWTRHQFTVANEYVDPAWGLASWIGSNLKGRWTASSAPTLDGTVIVLGFEDGNDAVMFRFLEGETAWLNKE